VLIYNISAQLTASFLDLARHFKTNPTDQGVLFWDNLEDIIFVASDPARARASLATFSCPSKISTNLKTKQTFSRFFFTKTKKWNWTN
jgi:hypothetical protein